MYLLFVFLQYSHTRESNKAVVNEDLNGLQSRRRPKSVEPFGHGTASDRFPSGSPHKEHRKCVPFYAFAV